MKTSASVIALLTAAVLAFPSVPCHAQSKAKQNSPPPLEDGKFRVHVETDEFPAMDNTLVLRIKIETAPTDADIGTTLEYRYLNKTSVRSWAGGLQKTNAQEILFVFQFSTVIDNKTTTPVFAYSLNQGSAGQNSGIYTAKDKANLAEVVSFKIQSGDYDLRSPLEIGTLAGEPIVLRVEPPEGWDK